VRRGGLLLSGIVLVAAVVAWVVGVGTADKPSPPPFSAGDSQVRAECLMGTYLPLQASGLRIWEKPPPREWRTVETAKGAIEAERGAVAVTLRPTEFGAKIALTGIKFEVLPQPNKPNAYAFYLPCKRRLVGAAIEADIDPPIELEASNADVEGSLGAGLHLPKSASPIRFPWTISLDQPLHLYLVVHAEHQYENWSAEISWKSGSREGTIHVNNGGKGYWIADTIGVGWVEPDGQGRWASRIGAP
jgi:hypothetical protein